MRGLLIKDAYVLMTQTRFFALINILMVVFPSDVTRGFAIIYAVLLPMTAFAFDEQAKWGRLASMMPYRARDMVISKYLLGICGGVGMSLLSIVSGAVLRSFAGVTDCLMMHAQPTVIVFGASMILLSANLPILFWLGAEKGRIAYIFVSVALACGMMGVVGEGYEAWIFPQWLTLPVVFGIGVVLLILSILLSMKIYDSKRR